MGRTITILSVDGGGIRTLISALLLAEIERRIDLPSSRLFQVTAGTSGGALVALGVASRDRDGVPHTAQSLVQFFLQDGKRIFHKPLRHRIASLCGLIGTVYPSSGLKQSFVDFFGQQSLRDALCDILVPTFDLTLHRPYFFSRRQAQAHEEENIPMHLAAHASFTAPAFFSPVSIHMAGSERPHLYADSGMFINNPMLAAFFAVRRWYPDADDVLVLSIGTGRLALSMVKGRHTLLGWALPAEGIQSDGQNDLTEAYLSNIFEILGTEKYHYVRLQPSVDPEHYSLIDASEKNIAALVHSAEKYIRQNDELLADLCHLLAKRSNG